MPFENIIINIVYIKLLNKKYYTILIIIFSNGMKTTNDYDKWYLYYYHISSFVSYIIAFSVLSIGFVQIPILLGFLLFYINLFFIN